MIYPPMRLDALVLKQAKIPSPQGMDHLVDDDASSPAWPRTGSGCWSSFSLIHDPLSFLLYGSGRLRGSEHPHSDFTRATFNTVTRPADGRRSTGADSRPTSGTPT